MRISIWPMIAVVVSYPCIAVAAESIGSPATGPAWYTVVTGIVAVPAAFVALIVSWNTGRKIRLESKKLELEISEKEKALSSPIRTEEKLELIAGPIGDAQRLLLIAVRYVILELTLTLVGMVSGILSQAFKFLFLGLWSLFPSNTPVMIAAAASQELVSTLFSILQWIIIAGFGWPLFKDACALLRIPIRSLFDLPRIGFASRGDTRGA